LDNLDKHNFGSDEPDKTHEMNEVEGNDDSIVENDLPEVNYVTYNSSLYHLPNSHSFETVPEGKSKSAIPKVSPDWEWIIPEVKSFMERDGFSRFEIKEYLQQTDLSLPTWATFFRHGYL